MAIEFVKPGAAVTIKLGYFGTVISGKNYGPGEVVSVTPMQAAMLIGNGKAVKYEPPPEEPKPEPKPEQASAVDEPKPKAPAAPRGRKGRNSHV